MDGEWEARPEKMRDETQTGRQAERGSTKKAVGPLGPHSPQSLIFRVPLRFPFPRPRLDPISLSLGRSPAGTAQSAPDTDTNHGESRYERST